LKIAFTPLVAYRLVNRAKRNFLKSKARDHWKSVCIDLPVLFRLNNKVSKAWNPTYGEATLITKKDNLTFNYGIVNEPMVKCGINLAWLVIELNAWVVSCNSPLANFNLVTHEFAHCLDFVLRGKMMPDKTCHDEFFQDLNKFMGGGDIEYIQIPNTKKVKEKVKKSLDSFNGEYTIAPSYYDLDLT
jgi:Mlc titration factor MtfA (ptsG expression regulator)